MFQSAAIKKVIVETNIRNLGVGNPNQSPVVREKSYETSRRNNTFSKSEEETSFYDILLMFDTAAVHHQKHPEVGHVIDFYLPTYNLWVQYDGAYWHGKIKPKKETARTAHIRQTMENDRIQNERIPNLVRYWSDEAMAAKRAGALAHFVGEKLRQKCDTITDQICHQFKKKVQHASDDIKNLSFDHTKLSASNFTLSTELLTKELIGFIEKYEWLGDIGVTPKWCFTARYEGLLAGVVLINEPTAYSHLLGPDTPKYEALIQRGATASWTPKNLGSRLVMFSCRWMVANTEKRLFVAYGDPSANEIGTIYQACNFGYLGNNFGEKVKHVHPTMGKEPFSGHSLRRTSSLKRWCAQNGIKIQKGWIKENGFKDLEAIPIEVISGWKGWIRKVLTESVKIDMPPKHKYALLLGIDKKETKRLAGMRTYQPLPYPKRAA